jgi:hypothetical protein
MESNMIARPDSERRGRAEMMLRADELFEEFSSLPVMTVINALAAAGAPLRSASSAPASPTEIVAAARDRLRASVASTRCGHP